MSSRCGAPREKRILSDNISTAFEPYREKAQYYRQNPDVVRQILDDGAEKARVIAEATIAEVRGKMGMHWRDAID